MAYLGDVPIDATVTVRVAWTLAPGSPDTSGALLTLVHATEGDILGPFPGVADGPNAWKAEVELPKGGRWRVRWATTPLGGFSNDTIYAQ